MTKKPATILKSLLARSLILRRTCIIAWHVAGIVLAYYCAFLLRFDGSIPAVFQPAFSEYWRLLAVICIPVFAFFHLYSGIWAYFSMYDLFRIGSALAVSMALFAAVVFFQTGRTFEHYPRSVFVITFLLLGLWMAGGRLAVRCYREYRTIRKAIVSGAGRAAVIVGNLSDVDHIIHSLPRATPSIGRFVAILTGDRKEHHLTIRGIRVKGSVSDAGRIARTTGADTILILPPYTRPKTMNMIVASCEDAGVKCTFRMIPSMSDIAAGKIELSTIRTVELEDLLGRPELKFDHEPVKEMIEGKSILVTGAGGSIGSELVNQIAQYRPGTLILMDSNEYSLYTIDMQIRKSKPDLRIVSVAGDAGSAGLVRNVLAKEKTNVVFHAAAYKHVPLMEINVSSCLANNTIATAALAAECEEAGVDRFVLVSTDKAVRPTSVMGASKRIAERIIQERPKSRTAFVTVRFGNVLGSSGSVVPLFQRQIREGGPVTVTSPNATRFFMSIPEAVDLILQASVTAHDREIMVLEMGESVKVADMARHLIELSGLRVPDDIEIVFTGLRPGEKEYEEVMTDDENVVRTQHDKIWVMQSKGNHTAPPIDIDRLRRLAAAQNEKRIREEMARLIPEANLAAESHESLG